MTRNPCLGWRHGDPVSWHIGTRVLSGKVVIRKSERTGQPYTKVQITGGGEIGKWVWPEGWVIGQGAKAGVCLECGQKFRTDDPDPYGFCLPCDREFAEARDAGGTIRKSRAYLHGATNPTVRIAPRTTAEITEIQRQKEEDESLYPF